MRVGFLEYYGQLNFEFEGHNDKRDIGNRRNIELGKELDKNKIEYENYKFSNHNKYDLIIQSNIPNLIILFKLKFKNLFKKVPILLLLEETEIARNRNLLLIKGLFDEVCIYTEEETFQYQLLSQPPLGMNKMTMMNCT